MHCGPTGIAGLLSLPGQLFYTYMFSHILICGGLVTSHSESRSIAREFEPCEHICSEAPRSRVGPMCSHVCVHMCAYTHHIIGLPAQDHLGCRLALSHEQLRHGPRCRRQLIRFMNLLSIQVENCRETQNGCQLLRVLWRALQDVLPGHNDVVSHATELRANSFETRTACTACTHANLQLSRAHTYIPTYAYVLLGNQSTMFKSQSNTSSSVSMQGTRHTKSSRSKARSCNMLGGPDMNLATAYPTLQC